MSHLIDSALVQAFENGSFGLPVAHENKHFEPAADIAYAELFIVPNPSEVLTLGDGGQDVFTGFMQIDLRYPLDEGSGPAKQKATDIQGVFKTGARFTYSGQEVFVTGSGRNGTGRREDGWYRTTITVNWEARVTR